MIPKFRVWDKDYEMLKPAAHIALQKKAVIYSIDGFAITTKPIKEIILMQSTGLEDKNGTEIYEGDIVQAVAFLKWIGIVKYDTEKAAFMLDGVNDTHTRDNYVYMSQFDDDFEILGNIYENPELMEV